VLALASHHCFNIAGNLEHFRGLHLWNWCSSTEVNTAAIIRDVSLGWYATHWFLGHSSGPYLHEQQRKAESEGGREREGEGKIFIEKWGFAVTFSCKEPFRDRERVPVF